MKLKISLVLVQTFGLLVLYTLSSREIKSSPQATQEFTETELTERFNRIMDEELSGVNVYIELPAVRKLEQLMRKSSARIVEEKAFGRVPEAEKNIRRFLRRVLVLAKSEAKRGNRWIIAIHMGHINLAPKGRPNTPGVGGICPLYPVC